MRGSVHPTILQHVRGMETRGVSETQGTSWRLSTGSASQRAFGMVEILEARAAPRLKRVVKRVEFKDHDGGRGAMHCYQGNR